jgi:hypothetical protein
LWTLAGHELNFLPSRKTLPLCLYVFSAVKQVESGILSLQAIMGYELTTTVSSAWVPCRRKKMRFTSSSVSFRQNLTLKGLALAGLATSGGGVNWSTSDRSLSWSDS